jgi:hypothetical protein
MFGKKEGIFIFLFFFGSPPEKSPEVARVRRLEAMDSSWQQQLDLVTQFGN